MKRLKSVVLICLTLWLSALQSAAAMSMAACRHVADHDAAAHTAATADAPRPIADTPRDGHDTAHLSASAHCVETGTARVPTADPSACDQCDQCHCAGGALLMAHAPLVPSALPDVLVDRGVQPVADRPFAPPHRPPKRSA